MKKFALLAAAAAFLAPAMISAASAESASVRIRVGEPGYRAYASDRVVVSSSPQHCRTVTVRTKRANGTVLIRKTRRCG